MTGRFIRTCVVAGVVACVGAAPAEAERFKGRTSQDRPVWLRTDDLGYAVKVTVAWRSRCAGDVRWRRVGWKATSLFRPFELSRGPDSFAMENVKERFRDRLRTYVVSGSVTGWRTSRRRWRGKFAGLVVVRERGRVVARCGTRVVRWRAGLQS